MHAKVRGIALETPGLGMGVEDLSFHPLPLGYLLPLGQWKRLHFLRCNWPRPLPVHKTEFSRRDETCNLSAGEKLHTGRRLPEILISLRSLL